MLGGYFAWRAAAVVACLAGLVGCASENLPRASNRSPSEARAPIARGELAMDAPSLDDIQCGQREGGEFTECIGAMYRSGRYRAMVRACDAALKEQHPEDERARVAETCIALLPPALWVANARPEAVTVLTAACEKTPENARIDRAARATVLTMHGIGRSAIDDDDKVHSMRDAVTAFAAACEVDAKRTAARAVALQKGRVALK